MSSAKICLQRRAGVEIDVVLVWCLDRWGRSLVDLVVTLKELAELGVSFVSLTEALDLTTATGRAMAGLLSVFAEFEHEILRERIRAGIAEARLQGKRFGRPVTAAKKAAQIRKLHRAGVSKAEIARRLELGRTSVRRILAPISRRNSVAYRRYAPSPETHDLFQLTARLVTRTCARVRRSIV